MTYKKTLAMRGKSCYYIDVKGKVIKNETIGKTYASCNRRTCACNCNAFNSTME